MLYIHPHSLASNIIRKRKRAVTSIKSFGCAWISFLLLTPAISMASVCMEGYVDGTDCIMFHVGNSIPDDTGSDPWDGDGTAIGTGFSGHGFAYTAPGLSGGSDVGGIFYKPSDEESLPYSSNDNVNEYPFADYDSYGEPATNPDEPNMWCNKTHHDLFSSPSYSGPDYGWAYSGVNCRVTALLKNAEDDNLHDNFFNATQYSWAGSGSTTRLKSAQLTPTNNFPLGISRPKMSNIVSASEREDLIDVMYDAGIRLLRLEMRDVSGSEFDRLVDTVAYAKTKTGLKVLVAILPPTDSQYYGGTKDDMQKAYTSNNDFKNFCGWYGAVKISSMDTIANEEGSDGFSARLDTAFGVFADPEADGNGTGQTADRLDNIIAFELFNEIDSICFNGDIGDGTNANSAGSDSATKKNDVADRYAALLDETRDKISELETDLGVTSGSIDLITAGMSKAYIRAVRDSTTGDDYAWDGMDFLDRVFDSANYVSGSVTGIGHHIYPDVTDVDGDLDSLLYAEIRALEDNTHADADSPVWITEWGITRAATWPGPTPYYEPSQRYRAMVEVMQNLNRDSGSDTTTGGYHDLDNIDIAQIILFGFDFHNGAKRVTNNKSYLDPSQDYRVYTKIYGQYVPIWPEARIFKYYASASETPYATSADSDSDGIVDSTELTNGDTRWFKPDTDGDGLLDGTEDADDDGVVDTGETDPADSDSDNDGLVDGFEVAYSGTGATELDPLDSDSDDDSTTDEDEDFDSDGLTNLEEQTEETDPNDSDSDDDTYSDGCEVDQSKDPLSAADHPASCS